MSEPRNRPGRRYRQPCKEVLDHLPELPESSAKVLCTLYGNRPLTGKQLREATGLPRRTLYTAIQRLKEAGVLKEQVSLRDSRQTFFWLDQEAPQVPGRLHSEGDEAVAAM